MIEFGRKYKDKISGFEGVATGQCTYISGCDQVLLTPKAKKSGEVPQASWFDVQRVVCIDGKNDKPIRLDNAKTPGADIPAPVR